MYWLPPFSANAMRVVQASTITAVTAQARADRKRCNIKQNSGNDKYANHSEPTDQEGKFQPWE